MKTILLIALCALSGCAKEQPTPFEPTDVKTTVYGCELMKKENPNADC